MTLILNGTTGVSAVDGSAATPAIQGNDPNTGVFFPAADTVAISTAGVERVQVDSSGNLVSTGPSILTRAAATQDGVELAGRAGGTTSLKVTITPTTLTANRSLTLPDSDGTILAASGGTLTVSQGGTGATSQTAYAVICGGTTSTGAYQSIAGVGSAGQVLTSNGAGALPTFQAVGGGFAAGTRLIFAQDAAPTGWTKDTTNYNNHALRVVTGTAGTTGGSVDFTTAFASQTPSGSVSVSVSGTVGSTTLATSQIPSHTHSYTAPSGGGSTDTGGGGPTSTTASNTGAQGGGGSHNHSFSGSGSGSFSGNAINLAVKYLNVITATKN